MASPLSVDTSAGLASSRDAFTIVVLGASGDLAHKKTYPSLYDLFVGNLLPSNLQIVGYGRKDIPDADFRKTLQSHLKGGTGAQIEDFLGLCIYRSGGYDDAGAMRRACDEVAAREAAAPAGNRLFYFAIPPTAFIGAAKTVHDGGLSSRGWNRIVIEKPFGSDLESSNALSAALSKWFKEDQVYRIDHYLGKEMVQNLMVLRFANTVFEPLWNRHHISNVQITFKEPFGTEGRGGYFDEFGIIRDVMQNHLLQVMSLVAMEAPVSSSAEDIRDEKVKVLRCTAPIEAREVVVGQFGPSAAGDKKGYTQEDGVPADSITPTFATAVLHINNARWKGVPFILKCGKALNERKAEIRIQFAAPGSGLFAVSSPHGHHGGGGGGASGSFGSPSGGAAGGGSSGSAASSGRTDSHSVVGTAADPALSRAGGGGAAGGSGADGRLRDRAESVELDADRCRVGVGQAPVCGSDTAVHNNELVIRIQPNEAVYLKMMCKLPGMEYSTVETELDLSYKSRYRARPPPEAYARLLLDVLRGDQSQFVRSDELQAAWSIFTPLLHHLQSARVHPIIYPFGSRGPPQADMLARRAGYVYEGHYSGEWRRTQDPGSGEAVLAAIERDFALPAERLHAIMGAFLKEMRDGLEKDEHSSTIKMIPAHVTKLPTGKETGSAWAVDMGGTNLRVVEVIMHGDGRLEHHESDTGKRRIPPEMQAAPGPVLFDFIAETMKNAGMPQGATVGFTFSYPTRQRAVNAGELIEWTKGFTSEGVEGSNVVRLLEEACERAHLRVRIAALVNDTVGTLMTTAYADPQCRIGVIIGTGSNAAYVEKAARIPKWTGPQGGDMVINMEWGGFGSGADKTMLPFSAADQELDAHSTYPGKQRYEKMISGMYLGEIVRLLLRELVGAGAVFVPAADGVKEAAPAASGASTPSAGAGGAGSGGGDKPVFSPSSRRTPGKVLETPEIFDTAYVSEICVDASPELTTTDRILREKLSIAHSTVQDRRIVKKVCTLVSRRAARLAAVGVAGCVTQMGNSGHVSAGIDGSVFKKHPLVRGWMKEALSELGVECELHEAEDGSGRGAAIIAVTAGTEPSAYA